MKKILRVEEKGSISENNHNDKGNSEVDNKKFLKHDLSRREEAFEEKNSLLTEIIKTKQGATVYNIFVTILLSLLLKNFLHHYLYKGEINLGLNLLISGFSKPHLIIAIWLGMFAASILCYYGFKIWAIIRNELPQNSIKIKLWDIFMIGMEIIYYSLFLYCTPFFINRNGIPSAASFALLTDNMRMLMVFYSFIRNNASRVLRNQKDNEPIVVPDLSKFLYFYFAPTLIYEDDYPRSQNRDWKIILGYVVEFLGVALFMSLLLEIFFIDQFVDYGLRAYSTNDIIIIIFNTSMAGLLLTCGLFYISLHVWSNMFAELMMFSDRAFYKDWWTSDNYEKHYRTWNITVHKWLYTYIFKIFYENVYSGSKFPAKLFVFFISAIFHDYILGFTFGFCLLVFMQWLLLLPLTTLQIKPNWIGNIVILYTIGLGTAAGIAYHAMEYFSRINCPIEQLTVYDYFKPHLFSCNK